MKPPRFHFGLPFRAATIWSNLEAGGVTDVVGAWQHVSQLMTVVALKQRYDGHAKRAAMVAAAHSYMARVVVVVDDPSLTSDLSFRQMKDRFARERRLYRVLTRGHLIRLIDRRCEASDRRVSEMDTCFGL